MNLYIGSKYNQICDSKGPHNNAAMIDLPDGTMHVQWVPVVREPGLSWDNLYFWVSQHAGFPSVSAKLVQCVDVMIPNLANVNVFEFETQVVIAHKKFNMAWQFSQVPNYRASTFDFASKHWQQVFPLQAPVIEAGKWALFCALYEITATGPHHIGVQFNGHYSPVSIQRQWVHTDEPDYLHFAGQFGSLNKGTSIEAVVGQRLVTL